MSYPKDPLPARTGSAILAAATVLLLGGLVTLFAASSGLGIALIGLGAALTAVVRTDRRRRQA